MVRRVFSWWLVGTIVLCSACTHGPPPEPATSSDSGDDSGDTAVTLQVISHTFNVVDIYLQRGGARQRLGGASGHSISVFKIPWRWLSGSSHVQLLARAVGDAVWASTDTLQVVPGSLVIWTLEPDLQRTTAVVH